MFKKIKNFFAKMPPKAIFILSAILIFAPTRFVAAADVIGVLLSPLTGLTYIFAKLFGYLLIFVGWVFAWSLDLVSNAENLAVINTGWEVSLGFVNMFFMLALLAIAISTILGEDIPAVSGLNYKKALPTFIMVILLINFSKVIGITIVDFVNNFTHYFLASIVKGGDITASMMGTFGISQIDAGTSAATADAMSKSPDSCTFCLDALFTQIMNLILVLVANFVLLAGIIYMIKRTFHIWLLLMIAPFAWFALIFPQTKKYWNDWWGQFIKWTIFPVVYLFFLYLAFQISVALKASNKLVTAEVGKYAGPSILNSVFDTLAGGSPVAKILAIAVFAFLSTMGIIAGQKLGVGGSNFVMNYANKMKGAANKKFSDLRAKGPLSAEKLGAKFGGMGAGLLAKSRIGAVAGYGKETRERLEQERLQEQQKKEILITLRGELDGITDSKERLKKLKEIRSAAGGKSDLDKIKDIIKGSEPPPEKPEKEK